MLEQRIKDLENRVAELEKVVKDKILLKVSIDKDNLVKAIVRANEEATTLGNAIKQHETLECTIKLPDYSSEQPRLTVTITHTIEEE
ncbi:hypothetical protein [Caloranaerobacter sp. DY30410]|uniref:hypothetical protein n=1 Tax=Caloranaerobacter sp. DY30410 TaxID=3238305 RepID=UPI003D07F19D